MDTLDLYINMRTTFAQIVSRCTQFAPQFRSGVAPATWLEDGVLYGFAKARATLLLYWLLSDAAHVLVPADFGPEADAVVLARLREFGILQGNDTLAAVAARMVERDRLKMIAFFRADMNKDETFDVGQRLGAVSNAIAAANTETLSLINTLGPVSTIKYVDVGGIVKKQGKTLAEMGINGAPLAGLLDTLAAEIRLTVPVT